MSTSSAFALSTNIADVPGVGARRAEAFRRLGIRGVADLIRHFPLRYERELSERPIGDVDDAPQTPSSVTVSGEIERVRVQPGRRSRFEATLRDGTGTVLLTWFNAPWMRGRLHPGMRIRTTGRTKRYGEHLQMVNPRWEALDPEVTTAPRDERRRPVYPASEELSSAQIESAVTAVLDAVLPLLDDHLPEEYRAERALPPLAACYRTMHAPEEDEALLAARRRLAFDELLMLQLGVMIKRRHRREALVAPALTHNEAIDRHITARFPFELTPSQREVVAEIATDLTGSTPMNRLLQGDVGAGKTVVALYAMLMAVASEQQAALMAPTELLAEQHYTLIRSMLEGANVDIRLLTGGLKTRERATLLEDLEAGRVDILIGTHALLTETVSFRGLALTVVDEQHRFGVHQRARLRSKPSEAEGAAGRTAVPHMLVMTATPIPRTMSLTVFGDLDISTIRELPPGRRPVGTRLVRPNDAPAVYEETAQRLAAGEQAYIVVPLIDESDTGLKAVKTHLEWLERGPLRSCRLAAVHGRLDRTERDGVMERFRRGELDALVATTVIEVGVDVPTATIMIVEHAERFGLAQLHQLRGRVGRGDRESSCILIAEPSTDEGTRRLAAIAATNDGFEIAERDLEIRGPGELFGARQSGLAPFLVAELPRDMELLRLARRDAAEWIDANPTLAGERDALLKKRLLKAHGKSLGLGDVG